MKLSPLRYPGGKGKMYNTVKQIIVNNYDEKIVYCEPFAGGAEVALKLLEDNLADRIIINDYDYAIYCFWFSVINYTSEFIKKIKDCIINLEERENQKSIYLSENVSMLDKGFATFYLNRVNRSGIINGGPISKNPDSKYPLDCRFKKDNLIKRIKWISSMKDRIYLTNEDAQAFLKNIDSRINEFDKVFLFIDPPYYVKGSTLYMNSYKHVDHVNLHDTIKGLKENISYIITYDDTKEIRNIYSDFSIKEYELTYTVADKKKGKEVLFHSESIELPKA